MSFITPPTETKGSKNSSLPASIPIFLKIKAEPNKDYNIYYITNVADSIMSSFEKVKDIPTAVSIED